ncbi:glycoside hydrolase family 18 protein [Mycena olivaceomarginata]|nr:glycoside hydrolase family 18 protein [Mycena olivaceomarginata]
MLLLPLLAVLQVLTHGRASETNSTSMIASAWYAGWHADSIPAETTSDVSLVSLDNSAPEVLPQFVSAAQDHWAFGGWAGSRFWSSNVATSQNRTLFVKTLIDLVKKYNLDGLDFDWEYPALSGIGSTLILSAATAMTPFTDWDGKPFDVSGFSKVLNYIAIMVYDINGPSWSSAVGPNAPLNDACAPESFRNGSVASAVNAWQAAGMPLAKIVLGVASYGHSFRVSESDAFSDDCSKNQLALYPPPSVPYLFDDCTQTPYVYNETTQVMISFDNAQSFGVKGDFIKSQGLGGFSMWEAGGDSGDILLDSIRESAGY